MEALKKAREVKEDSRALVEGIEKIKTELITKAGGGRDPKTGKIKNAREETKVETMMVGAEGSESGIGYKLEDDLNEYVAMINQKVGMSLDKIAKDNSDNPDPMQRGKNFAQASFAQTPVAAALAVLTYCQSEVLRYEAEALKELGAQAQGKVIKFDKIQATYTAESNIVANGQSYEAKMFLFASASKLKTNMTVNGKAIKQVDGVGTIKIPATGGSNAGTKKSWKGKISLPEKDETFEVEGEYTVIAPTMVIQSAAVQALYEGCGNELKILVPALGSSYKPSFGGSGAQFLPGSQVGDVTVVPAMGANSVTISVSSGGQPIGTEKIRVRSVPPATAVIAGFTEEEMQTGKRGWKPRQVTIQLKPDPDFASFLPKEANYRVNQWSASLVRGGRKAIQENAVGPTANLRQIGASSNRGDILSIQIKNAQRSNFRGQLLPAKVANRIINLPIN